MGEALWIAGATEIVFTTTTWLAQTFSPLWSHNCWQIRLNIHNRDWISNIKVSIQYLKPDGTPTGEDLVSLTFTSSMFSQIERMTTFQTRFPAIRLVASIKYAIILKQECLIPLMHPSVAYIPAPSQYPRGKLIRSIDSGATWNTTDLGALLFAEFGDPPLPASEFVAPIKQWAVFDMVVTPYWVNACIRVSTSQPCRLKLLRARQQPVPRKTFIIRRGMRVYCYKNTPYPVLEIYQQLEYGESLFHTFFVIGLTPGQPYWVTFTADANLEQTRSCSQYWTIYHPLEQPPFTITRRPAYDGTINQINYIHPPGTIHTYECVDEVTPDEDATFIMNYPGYTGWKTTTWKIEPITGFDQPISYLRITARLARWGGYAYASYAREVIKTHGIVYYSEVETYLDTAYQYRDFIWTLNPFTNLPWTLDEINSLEIGISLYRYLGVGWSTSAKCTQLYATITHTCSAYN